MYYNFKIPFALYYVESNEDTFYVGDTHINRQNYEWFDLIVVTSGALYLEEEGVRYEVKRKQGLILSPFDHHFSFKACDKETHFYWVHFQTSGKWMMSQGIEDDLNFEWLQLKKFFTLQQEEPFYNLFEDLNNYTQLTHSSQKIEQQILFQKLVKFLLNNDTTVISKRVTEIAEKAATWINENYANDKTLALMSDELNFNLTYVSRCMKQVYGLNSMNYLKQIRLKKAKNYLISTNEPIEKIAEKSGFNSLSFFSKTFVKEIGVTPSSFRNQYRTTNKQRGMT